MRIRRNDDSPVNPHIDAVLLKMEKCDPSSQEHARLMKTLKQLYKLKADDRRQPMSRDALFTGLVQLVGILAVLHFEKLSVVTSKAWDIATRRSKT